MTRLWITLHDGFATSHNDASILLQQKLNSIFIIIVASVFVLLVCCLFKLENY